MATAVVVYVINTDDRSDLPGMLRMDHDAVFFEARGEDVSWHGLIETLYLGNVEYTSEEQSYALWIINRKE